MNGIYIVKIQEELVIYLVNLLTSHIYEGLDSIYKTAKQYAKSEEVLKVFQEFLLEIQNWRPEILDTEVKRIVLECNISDETMLNIIKNIIKYTILIYTLNEKDKIKFEPSFTLNDFFHKIYIILSKRLYSNPYLCYDGLCPNDINNNIILTKSLIEKTIKEVLYSYIPINDISKFLLELDTSNIIISKKDDKAPLLSDSFNLSDNIRNLINEEIHRIKSPASDKINPVNQGIAPIVPTAPVLSEKPIINKPLDLLPQKGGVISPDNVINNDKIEKLSSSHNLKQINDELKQNLEKSQTDLIKKLDNDLHGGNQKPTLIESDSDTSSNYANNEDNINVYSNANKTSTQSAVFVPKNVIPKYENIKL